ncbi:MAG: murein hydrolase activator EnvC family protein [Candidatus Aquicultorales bacterium]
MRPNRRSIKIPALILVAALLVSASPVFGTPEEDRRLLDETNANITEHERQLDENKSQQQALLDQIAETDKRLVAANAEADRLGRELDGTVDRRIATEQELAKAQADLLQTQEQLRQAKQRLAKYKDTLNERLKSVYKNGSSSYVQVILKSSDFSDMLNRLSFLKLIVEQDARLVRESKEAKEAVEVKEAEQVRIKQSIEVKREAILAEEERIAYLKSEQERAREAAAAQLNQSNALKEQLKQNEAALEETIRQEKEDAASIAARMGSYGNRFVSRTGWVWPVGTPADITSPFGWRVHPIYGDNRFHSGVDIAVAYGTPVVAANNGVVEDVGWWGGYGLIVAINHGDGIGSLYAHLSSTVVEIGQDVKAGDVIGYVGSTGNSTGPHLHFEILVDGAQVDPMQWY